MAKLISESFDELASEQLHFEEEQYLDSLAASQLQSELDSHVADLTSKPTVSSPSSSSSPSTSKSTQSELKQQLRDRQSTLQNEDLDPARALMIASSEMNASVRARSKKTEFDFEADFVPLDDSDGTGWETFTRLPRLPRSSRYVDKTPRWVAL